MSLFSVCEQKLIKIPYLNYLFVNIFKYRYLRLEIWGNEIMSEAIDKQMNLFVSDTLLSNPRYKNKLMIDIILSYLRYEIIPSEYFLFDFPNCKHKRRKSFLSLKHKDLMMIKKVGMGYNFDILEDKAMFYEKFNSYFKREVCIIKNKSDFAVFKSFVSNHPLFIAKPLNGQCGKGIRRYDINKQPVDQLFSLLCDDGMWICEELIIADATISQWHPESLNTVRVNSFINRNGFFILKPVFRVGRGGVLLIMPTLVGFWPLLMNEMEL